MKLVNSAALETKQEEVIINYKLSYDLDIAMLKAEVTPAEQKVLLRDESFMYRIAFEDAMIQEKIVKTMITNMTMFDDPRISQKAAIDLGNLLYKKKFKATDETVKNQVPDKIVLSGVSGDAEDEDCQP